MLHAKNRTLVTTLATLSLMGMPVLAYADPKPPVMGMTLT